MENKIKKWKLTNRLAYCELTGRRIWPISASWVLVIGDNGFNTYKNKDDNLWHTSPRWLIPYKRSKFCNYFGCETHITTDRMKDVIPILEQFIRDTGGQGYYDD